MSLGDIIEQAAEEAGLTLIKKVKGSAKKVRLQKRIKVASLSDRYLAIGKALEHWPRWFEKDMWNVISFRLEHTIEYVTVDISFYESLIVPENENKDEWLVSVIKRRYRDWDSMEIEGEICQNET